MDRWVRGERDTEKAVAEGAMEMRGNSRQPPTPRRAQGYPELVSAELPRGTGLAFAPRREETLSATSSSSSMPNLKGQRECKTRYLDNAAGTPSLWYPGPPISSRVCSFSKLCILMGPDVLHAPRPPPAPNGRSACANARILGSVRVASPPREFPRYWPRGTSNRTNSKVLLVEGVLVWPILR